MKRIEKLDINIKFFLTFEFHSRLKKNRKPQISNCDANLHREKPLLIHLINSLS